MRLLTTFAFLVPESAFAGGFERPIPQAQTAAAEFWFFVACLALVAALAGVQYLVSRR
ncbi:hypothetical protein [Defluviimonas salinarum]|uniref:Protein NnrT n=1 Tax=Defluviimonas salinarum TaxID=2992147 RepID=A0ABT3J9Q7_9RHOB|nr:hypothetical protein [Defluviimonas salinarum]MCW3784406.1 hypothetical protein [Defluviimonas salinarum]